MTKALVTGATGFLGWHVATRLQALGWQVTAQGRNADVGRELERRGVRFYPAELADRDRMRDACANQRYVFHCGALSSAWGPYRAFYESNVEGTRHVIDGCLAAGVERLVHVSTPSVCFDFRDREAIRESDPLPRRAANAYAHTKRMAEDDVRRAFAAGLRGVIIRPRAVFGPRDAALLPRLLRANDAGGVPMFRGGGAVVDLTYVDNVVDAMVAAAVSAPESAMGRIYHLTNGEPLPLKEALVTLFGKLGVPLRERRLPYGAAYAAAGLLELAYRLLPLRGEPIVTRYGVGVLARTQTLDIREARERLGYAPAVSIEEGFERYAEWWRESR